MGKDKKITWTHEPKGIRLGEISKIKKGTYENIEPTDEFNQRKWEKKRTILAVEAMPEKMLRNDDCGNGQVGKLENAIVVVGFLHRPGGRTKVIRGSRRSPQTKTTRRA